jgi:hypothetical protein
MCIIQREYYTVNIEQAQLILSREKAVKRTPYGRPIHDVAIDGLESTLDDVKNYDNEVVQCESCGFVVSILLTENGCPNCGIEELTTNIKE